MSELSNTVRLSVEGKIATITLNRPNSRNAMDAELLIALQDALRKVKDSSANVLVLTGEGPAFSAGGDIKTMLQEMNPDGFEEIMGIIKDIIVTLYTLPKITISAVNGAAAGLGLSLALASDFVIAHNSAKIAMNFIGIGLIPDGGGHFFMKKRLGEVKAKQVIWEGKRMTAEEAKQIGLVDDVVNGDLQVYLTNRLNLLLSSPLKAMIETKLLYAEYYRSELEHILDRETIGQKNMRQTKDHAEGIKAFLEKRAPNYQGE